MNLQMVDLLGQYQQIETEITQAIKQVLENTAFINGPQVKEFAHALGEYLGSNVIPCANGTDALQIAMMGLGLQPGDEVILPVHTYVATAEVIGLLRLTPVFVDVDPDLFTLDMEQVKAAITPKTKAIVPVHLYGQCADMESLLALVEGTDIAIVEDNAQAIGADYLFSDGKTQKAGTIGTIGCTSFFPSKNLGCYGDGGTMMTSDLGLAKTLQMIASHGQSKKYYHDLIGVNSRLDTLQAAILQVKLPKLDLYNAARQKAAEFYDVALADVAELQTPKRAAYSSHVFHQYTVKVADGKRDTLKEFLQEKGIPSMIYYPVPLHLQKAYAVYGYKKGDFPVAEALSESVISLPIHTEMTESQLSYICESIRQFFK